MLRINPKDVAIYAKEVAIITGDSRFEAIADYRDRVWKRNRPHTFTGQTRREQVQKLCAASHKVQAILQDATATLSSNSNVARVIDTARAELRHERQGLNLSDADFQSVEDHVVSTLRTTYGTRSEEPTAAAFVATSASTAAAELRAVADAADAQAVAIATVTASEAAVACSTVVLASATESVSAAKADARVAEKELESSSSTLDAAACAAATARTAATRASVTAAEAALEVAASAVGAARESARATAAATAVALESAACRVSATRHAAKRARVSSLVEDLKTHELLIGEFHGFRCVVRGKIDRVEETSEGRRLIEIKNRTQRLFHQVRSYENVQVQVYLQMLDLPRAQLWERFGEEQEKHDVARDDELYATHILPCLRAFCADLCAKMSSTKGEPEF
jgi:ABC-type dipeptide/oligopeptide/nickel transport system ATPase subunit